MLESFLDICNLSQIYPRLCPSEFVNQVRSCAVLYLEWLASTLFPDGLIPLFNDSAFGVSIPPNDIFDYAERLSLNVNQRRSEKLELIDRPETGLYGCRVGKDMFIIDCGDIGPTYQPGHTHCDFLSYELMLANQRIAVDTGVCEYEPGPLRNYVRSTKAHNTVSVDGGEQSEIWGEFRVARRAKKIAAKINMNNKTVDFRGAYEGFYNIKNQIRHKRTVEISLSAGGDRIKKLVISDYLDGDGHHSAESFVHLHPDISTDCSKDGEIGLNHNNSAIGSIQLSADQAYRIESGIYCPEFGKQVPNEVLVLEIQGNMPLSLSYEFIINLY